MHSGVYWRWEDPTMFENINSYEELIEYLDQRSAEFVPSSETLEDTAKRWGVELKRKGNRKPPGE